MLGLIHTMNKNHVSVVHNISTGTQQAHPGLLTTFQGDMKISMVQHTQVNFREVSSPLSCSTPAILIFPHTSNSKLTPSSRTLCLLHLLLVSFHSTLASIHFFSLNLSSQQPLRGHFSDCFYLKVPTPLLSDELFILCTYH